MTVVIQYANAYFNLKNQDLQSNAFVETKTNLTEVYLLMLYVLHVSMNKELRSWSESSLASSRARASSG